MQMTLYRVLVGNLYHNLNMKKMDIKQDEVNTTACIHGNQTAGASKSSYAVVTSQNSGVSFSQLVG
jgi:hypothetical protein